MATRRPKGEGSVHRRADGKWIGRLYYVDPVTDVAKRAQATGGTKAEVSRRLRAIQDRIQQGAPARDDSATFGTFATRWIGSSLEASDRKHSTKVLYAGLTRTHIVDSQLGKTRMNALKPTTVERFVTQLRGKGLSPSSVRQIYTVARAIGDAAVRDGLLAKNPFVAVRRPKAPTAEATFLQPHEIAHLLTNAETSRYAPLFEFLVNTGLRRGEALALKWSDVDLHNQVLRVRGTLARIDGDLKITAPKSDRSRRTIPLSARATADPRAGPGPDATRPPRGAAAVAGHRLGVRHRDRRTLRPRNALRALKAAARKAALPDVGLHTLRHSAASVMLTNGVPITVVSQILGHSGISITVDVYGHVAPDVSRAALDVLGAALATPRPPPSSDSANA